MGPVVSSFPESQPRSGAAAEAGRWLSGRKQGEASSRREAGRGRPAVRCPSIELAGLGTGDTTAVDARVESNIGHLGPRAQT